MWREPGNIHGFVLGGTFHRKGWVTTQTPIATTVSGEVNDVNYFHVQPHYCYVWQAEPHHPLFEVTKPIEPLVLDVVTLGSTRVTCRTKAGYIK